MVLRKTLAVAKSSLAAAGDGDPALLGALDSGFLLASRSPVEGEKKDARESHAFSPRLAYEEGA